MSYNILIIICFARNPACLSTVNWALKLVFISTFHIPPGWQNYIDRPQLYTQTFTYSLILTIIEMFNGKNECCGYPALKHPNVLYKSLLRSIGIRSFHWDQRIYILRERTRTAPPVVLSRRCLSPPALSAVIQTDREYRSSIQQTKQRKASQFKRGGLLSVL